MSRFCGYVTFFTISVEIAATYKSKPVEKLVTEVTDRTNSRLFNASIGANEPRTKYTSILPPPNVTGNLHLGHVLMATVQDAICRWKTLNGFDVQWVPGLDHAGIGTQVVVEKSLKSKKDLTRHDIGRTAFVQEIWKWKEEKGHQIRDDLIRLGTIFNWEREYFTMDEVRQREIRFDDSCKEFMVFRFVEFVAGSCGSIRTTFRGENDLSQRSDDKLVVFIGIGHIRHRSGHH